MNTFKSFDEETVQKIMNAANNSNKISIAVGVGLAIAGVSLHVIGRLRSNVQINSVMK